MSNINSRCKPISRGVLPDQSEVVGTRLQDGTHQEKAAAQQYFQDAEREKASHELQNVALSREIAKITSNDRARRRSPRIIRC